MNSSASANLAYVAQTMTYVVTTDVSSVSVADVIDLRGVPRARIIVDADGKKHLVYEEGALCAFPPIDLGGVSSENLDDFLYGTSQ